MFYAQSRAFWGKADVWLKESSEVVEELTASIFGPACGGSSIIETLESSNNKA